MRFNLRFVFLVTTVVACIVGGLCFAGRWCLGPIVPQATLDRLRDGMTASEVEEILGPPTAYGETRCWYYSKLFNPGWLTVDFDDQGRMASYGQELAFP